MFPCNIVMDLCNLNQQLKSLFIRVCSMEWLFVVTESEVSLTVINIKIESFITFVDLLCCLSFPLCTNPCKPNGSF